MTSTTRKYGRSEVELAPVSHGVYFLYEATELVYIGRAAGIGVSIRSRLRDHFCGTGAKGTENATEFSFRESHEPEMAEISELCGFIHKWGRPPRYNVQIPRHVGTEV